jgi:general secretion pathway protein J
MALAPHSFHTHRPAQAARGFTLVELLVAMAIMGLMALLSWRGLDGMVRAQEQTRQRGDQLLVLQAALTQWGADLDALLPLPHTTPLDWDGQVLRITRRSSAIPDEGALVVAWARRNVDGTSQWLRWQSPPLRTRSAWQQAWQQAAQWARNPGDADRRAEVALLPLADWQVFYFRGDAWSNPMSSSGTPPGDLDAVGALIPDGVRLQLDLPPGPGMAGRITRDWVSPLKGGGKT